jgi:predicted nucleic acid-binding Zn ribbon protein
MNDDPLRSCPQCGKEIRRVINGGSGIIFKGSGFYVTDNSKKSGDGKSAPSKTAPKAAEPACAGCANAGNACPAKEAAGT